MRGGIRVRSIALLYNQAKQEACSIIEHITPLLETAGIRVFSQAVGVGFEAEKSLEHLREVELAFVLGGDGTLLGVARQLAPFCIPILGVNVGHLGFLSESEPGDVEEAVRRVIEQEYDLEQRLMLEVSVYRSGNRIRTGVGLNDVGVAKGSFARMVTIDVHVDDIYVDTFSGDGVIISSPTGSTGYSLSCGGPIVSPQLQVMVVTPICPHTLFSRPIVIDDKQEIGLLVHAVHHDLCLTIDGQVGVRLEPEDVIRVKKSEFHTTLVKWRDREFFTVLRQKLHSTGLMNRKA
jgi:NAD+ kinase